MVKKIRLNDQQWHTLLALMEAHAKPCAAEPLVISERLKSNGLVAADRRGCHFLTEQGRQRVKLGR